MAASMAYDWPAARSLEVAYAAFVEGRPFNDYTLPFVSLLSGGRMRKLLRRHLPGNIEDLPIPFFCVSSNLNTGKSNVHQRGEIWKALSASAALPGVMPPAVYRGQLAIDGSVLNSLPVDVMQEMPVAQVIAVDLSTRKEYKLEYKYVPSAWTILKSKLFGGKRARVPGLATLMLKSTEIGTVARVRELVARADLLLAPAVERFNILDVTRFHEIVEAGYEHAREMLPGWAGAPGRPRRLLGRQKLPRHHDGVLAALVRGVVVRPAADLVEALAVVQRDRARIGRPHFQEDPVGHVPARDVHQPAQQVPAVAVALVLGLDADVEHVRLAGGAAEHAVADDAGAAVEHPAFVADPQAVAEDARRPREMRRRAVRSPTPPRCRPGAWRGSARRRTAARSSRDSGAAPAGAATARA